MADYSGYTDEERRASLLQTQWFRRDKGGYFKWVGKKTWEKPEYNVTMCRTGTGFAVLTVGAYTQEEAEQLALDKAGDFLYSEKTADYAVVRSERVA